MDQQPVIEIESGREEILFRTKSPHKITSHSARKSVYGVNAFRMVNNFIDLILKIEGVNWAQLESDYTLFVTLRSGLSEKYLVRIPSEIIKIIRESSGIDFTATL